MIVGSFVAAFWLMIATVNVLDASIRKKESSSTNNVQYMALQFQSESDIPDDCQNELTIPTAALSGCSQVDWEYLCSNHFFDSCDQVLRYIFHLQYTDGEKKFITKLLDGIVKYGAQLVCNITQNAIADVINDGGGKKCIQENSEDLNYCSFVSIVKFTTGQDVESVCKALDYSFRCNMAAIEGCKETSTLYEMWDSYYRQVIPQTPCNRFSDYGSGSSQNKYDLIHFLVIQIVAFIIYTRINKM